MNENCKCADLFCRQELGRTPIAPEEMMDTGEIWNKYELTPEEFLRFYKNMENFTDEYKPLIDPCNDWCYVIVRPCEVEETRKEKIKRLIKAMDPEVLEELINVLCEV